MEAVTKQPMTTPSGHLTAAGELVAIGIMCGVILAIAIVVWIWATLGIRRERREKP